MSNDLNIHIGDIAYVYDHEAASQKGYFDLTITNTSEYFPYSALMNGITGNFGRINLQTGKDVDLTFTMKHTEGAKAGTYPHPREMEWSFVDLDTNGMEMDGAEQVTMLDATDYWVVDKPNPTDLSVKTIPNTKSATGNAFEVKALRRGFECDNPTDISDMKVVTCNGNIVDQQKRAATFTFHNRFDFRVNLKAFPTRRRTEGRNFLYYCKFLIAWGRDC